MASSTVPARVSHSRALEPLRELTRCSLRSPYPAPQTASASALINASANVLTIARNRSGLAASICSRHSPAGSTLLGAVIASLSLISTWSSEKDQRGDRLPSHDTLVSEPVVHHLHGRD